MPVEHLPRVPFRYDITLPDPHSPMYDDQLDLVDPVLQLDMKATSGRMNVWKIEVRAYWTEDGETVKGMDIYFPYIGTLRYRFPQPNCPAGFRGNQATSRAEANGKGDWLNYAEDCANLIFLTRISDGLRRNRAGILD